MKSLTIKNRTSSPLYFVFCTVSRCTCNVCMEWLVCEKAPIAGWEGVTYGQLRVEAFGERADRCCHQWDCIGACFFDHVPTVSKSMMFDYDEDASYTIGNGKAELKFTYTGEDCAYIPRGSFSGTSNSSGDSSGIGGVVQFASTASQVFQGAQLVSDILENVDPGDVADVIGEVATDVTVGAAAAAVGCTIS